MAQKRQFWQSPRLCAGCWDVFEFSPSQSPSLRCLTGAQTRVLVGHLELESILLALQSEVCNSGCTGHPSRQTRTDSLPSPAGRATHQRRRMRMLWAEPLGSQPEPWGAAHGKAEDTRMTISTECGPSSHTLEWAGQLENISRLPGFFFKSGL